MSIEKTSRFLYFFIFMVMAVALTIAGVRMKIKYRFWMDIWVIALPAAFCFIFAIIGLIGEFPDLPCLVDYVDDVRKDPVVVVKDGKEVKAQVIAKEEIDENQKLPKSSQEKPPMEEKSAKFSDTPSLVIEVSK